MRLRKQTTTNRRPAARRRGTIAVELMILGPVLGFLAVSAVHASQMSLLWSTLAVVGVYVLMRVTGELTCTR